MRLFLELLSAVSTLAGAIVGAYGVIYDFKDEAGRITKWGKRSIAAIIGACAVALGTQAFQILERKKSDEEAAKKEREVALYRHRAENPLGVFVATVWLSFPKADYARGRQELEDSLKQIRLVVGVFRNLVPETENDYFEELAFSMEPATGQTPPFPLPANETGVQVRETNTTFEVTIWNVRPAIGKQPPSMSSWLDIVGKPFRFRLEDGGGREWKYELTGFRLLNERGNGLSFGRKEIKRMEPRMTRVPPYGVTLRISYDYEAVEEPFELYPSEIAEINAMGRSQ